MGILWINLLHLHQPPFQTNNHSLLKAICAKSYLFIIRTLKKYPEARCTINITGSLTEQLKKYRHRNVILGLKELALNGQIEFTSTAKYHPILPLLPDDEIIRQTELNDKINSACFGEAYQPKGFFLPEMAYSQRVGELIAKKYQWIVLDEIAYQGNLGSNINTQTRYHLQNTKLGIIFRNRTLSKSYPPQQILKNLDNPEFPQRIITATDGEMYGYYHEDEEKEFSRTLHSSKVKTQLMSQYIKSLKTNCEILPKESSWESSEEDMKNQIPYPLWNHSKNTLHKKLWDFTNEVVRLNHEFNPEKKQIWPQKHLDKGLSSCTFWWASKIKPDVFSPVAWNPDLVELGLQELILSVRSLENIPPDAKIHIEELYHEIKKEIWKEHWRGSETGN